MEGTGGGGASQKSQILAFECEIFHSLFFHPYFKTFALAPLKEICSQGKCVSINEGRCRFEAGSILLIDYSHPSFQVFLTNQEREEGLRKLVAPCSPALLPDYLKQAQTQSEPLKPFFKPPPCKLVCSVLLLSDPHPSILCSSAFSFSASSLT